ncbi:MAG: xylulokinase, partial [Anaerolineae bacterium]|nr:xylulokinase [Anaerolineae bacterium]
PAETITAAGGGTESSVWRQIQADVFGVPLQQTLLAEQAAVGAALLAGLGVGRYTDLHQACQAAVRVGPITTPDATRYARYEMLYVQFCELYPRLRADFHRLARYETG